MQINLRRETLQLTRAGMLAAAAIALSAAESLFPALPFLPPGAKPGFSNLACMLAASGMGLGPAFSVAVCKALFAGLTRGLSAGLLSLCGGLLSTAVTFLLLKGRHFGYVGIGIAGAVGHNLRRSVLRHPVLHAAAVRGADRNADRTSFWAAGAAAFGAAFRPADVEAPARMFDFLSFC